MRYVQTEDNLWFKLDVDLDETKFTLTPTNDIVDNTWTQKGLNVSPIRIKLSNNTDEVCIHLRGKLIKTDVSALNDLKVLLDTINCIKNNNFDSMTKIIDINEIIK